MMEEPISFTLVFASTSDTSVRKTEVVEAVSLDIAANDALEEPDADWHLVGVHETDMLDNDRRQ